jgi:putative flippase GtrA
MAHLTGFLETNDTLRYIRRFLTVGMLGTLIDIALFTVLRVLLGIPTLAANTLSYSAGIVNNFVWHRRWTFAHRSRKAPGAQFSQFVVVSLSALMLNNLIVLWLAPSLGVLFANAGYGALVAKICATGVGVCWNFLANNLWTFRDAPQRVQQ